AILASIAVIVDFILVHGPRLKNWGADNMHPERQKIYNISVNVLLIVALVLSGLSFYLSRDASAVPGGGTQKEIPEFDAQYTGIINGYGLDMASSCFMSVNGSALLSRQWGYKAAIACFVYDGREDILDAPYLQLSNLYDVRSGEVVMRATFQEYFNKYRSAMGAIGINIALLNVPTGIQTSQFTTLRQARAV